MEEKSQPGIQILTVLSDEILAKNARINWCHPIQLFARTENIYLFYVGHTNWRNKNLAHLI